MQELFFVGGFFLLMFFAVSLVFQRLRLPPLLAYIFLGLALAPFLMELWVSIIENIAHVGIVLLFLLLGLQFPLNRLLSISRRIWPVGLLDIVLNFGISLIIAYLLGLSLMSALIISGVAYATSSSITIKMSEETKRSTTPEAEFSLALLIFEDLASPILVSLLAGLIIQDTITITLLLFILLKAIFISVIAILIAIHGFKRFEIFLQHYISTELMPLFAISLALICSGFAVYLGLSELLGAFLAGVMLSEAGTSKELEKIIIPLKDVTLPFFFFWFGTSISFGQGEVPVFTLIVLILWGIVGKVIVGYYGGKTYGLSSKGAIRASFSLIPRGEFSVVIATLASYALRISAGIYIVVTSIIGVFLFRGAPKIADYLFNRNK
ncbi:MAG: cation:proton antiporter [Clostridia bacterium]|jgi:CPA2 family monovalent cation:H+ antiporter-2|nr:cation:proton antiporter [Clostridia bacterium]